MASKENKGGILKNDQVEKDLLARNKDATTGNTYTGAQDTGDKIIRQEGNDVQQADGRPAADKSEES